FSLARILERLLDLTAGDELATQKAHREIHAAPDQRLPALAQQRGERLFERSLAPRFDDPPGDEKAPCGRVDEQRWRCTDVRRPVACADLVANQTIAG